MTVHLTSIVALYLCSTSLCQSGRKNTQDQADRRSLRELIAVRDHQVQNRKTQANAVATVVMARSEAAPSAPAPAQYKQYCRLLAVVDII